MMLWVRRASVWQNRTGELIFLGAVGCSTFLDRDGILLNQKYFLYWHFTSHTCLETEEFLRAQFQVDCKILETVLELVMYMACIFLTFRRLNCIYFLNEWL